MANNRTKIENPDGSGYSIEKMTVSQAIEYALRYSKEFDGAFTVYREVKADESQSEFIRMFNLWEWKRVGYAEDGKWYPTRR